MSHEVNRGRTWVVDADIRSFFDSMDHDLLLGFLEERISDRRVLKLISTWLRAGVLEGSTLLHPETGSPQGGPITPHTQYNPASVDRQAGWGSNGG